MKKSLFLFSLAAVAMTFMATSCKTQQAAEPVAATPVTAPAAQQQQTSTADKSYLNDLLNKDYSLKNYLPEEPKPLAWVDEPVTETVDELMPSITATKGNTGMRYMPAGVTMSKDDNATYFYFDTDANGKPGPLHMRVQYFADDPLNFNKAEYRINGFVYDLVPATVETGKQGKKMFWEYCDVPMNNMTKDIVYALSHGDWVQQRLHGADGMVHSKLLSDQQRKDFYNVLKLYQLMGGTF